ncbi:MAG: Metallophosphoesterase, MG_246/BB_0505 family [Parcubacteria group bacterium GW2011_GWD2_38_12]|nr:MAG: Metallophosphoesterase, MG_246/BB_0505 family [Parcubacteria group bacterium GW2011_GWC2_36_17]KKQ40508.1 MAG: Metallophosphoesterase, MG_246/BB_0505 family [Candidatus Moranbacteria bacterium GW2011_GWF2_37_7]KKQ52298.1 MAG: Metallophosphoesterase, MG_246/BB_0505 family [Parcubacteria group bacterium GW2011_GWD2_38_12]KKQ58583.1 MAG: Metallophosphoesterase, MG_246/BB_0505 family [Parcubacteria group bacterium GW2011_GWC1_38_17]KKQ58683.1 MAG: Metallophosphoesterase, MG_246/BB_0505 fami
MIKIIFFGDIFGKPGRNAIKKILPELKEKYRPDLIIANAENLSHGSGVTVSTIAEMREAGIDVFTSGNHVFNKQEEAQKILNEPDSPLLRPANYPSEDPGKGAKLIRIKDVNILVFNLLGRVFMKEDVEDPFTTAQNIIDYHKKDVNIFILDFHAEATSEKVALMYYLDGKISALIGTHTHIPTADNKITKKGTAYITDIGMVGPTDSVIGLKKEPVIEQYLTQIKQKMEVPENGDLEINAIYLEIDENTGKALKLEKIRKLVA